MIPISKKKARHQFNDGLNAAKTIYSETRGADPSVVRFIIRLVPPKNLEFSGRETMLIPLLGGSGIMGTLGAGSCKTGLCSGFVFPVWFPF